MKERPILFSGPMVRAILEGRKKMTRRIMNPQPEGEKAELSEWSKGIASACHDHSPEPQRLIEHSHRLDGRLFPFRQPCGSLIGYRCPYGFKNDRLWVRETWTVDKCWDDYKPSDIPAGRSIEYWSTDIPFLLGKKRQSIFMPRWASRITLEIVNIWVERLQDINEEDAISEGVISHPVWKRFAIDEFKKLWDSINTKKYPWTSNPWVWVVEFKQINCTTSARPESEQKNEKTAPVQGKMEAASGFEPKDAYQRPENKY